MLIPQTKVAVLLAAYNGKVWLEEQLATIQAQRGVAVHIYISVDASSDGTEIWCSDYARRHGNVSLVPPAEQCGGAARNFFHLICNVNFEEFDLVALADQDDRWQLDKLSRAAMCIAETSAQAYSSSVTAFWPDGRRKFLSKSQRQVKWDHYFEAAGPGCTYVMTKTFARYLQGQVRDKWVELQRVSLHDWYIYALARSQGYAWHIDNQSGLDYRQHDNNQFGANVGYVALKSRYLKIRSGWWLGQVQLIESLVNANAACRPTWRALNRSALIRLGLCAYQCRRRMRDKIYFAALCFALAIIGTRME